MSLTRLINAAIKQFSSSSSEAAIKTVTALRDVTQHAPTSSKGQFLDEESEIATPPEINALRSAPRDRLPTECAVILDTMGDDIDWHGSGRARSCAYTQIVGPGSRYDHDDIRFGMFFMPARYHYRQHVHGADEIYIVVAGHGEWSLNRQPFILKKPSNRIEVRSMTAHALRTDQSPMLMLWSWTGDISLNRYRFVD